MVRENKEKLIWEFLNTLEDELQNQKISNIGYQTFKKYYFSWSKNFSWIRKYCYLERIMPLINLVRSQGESKNVLDIGCGCGSEAILCAFFGCQVFGVDLSQERIACAEERKLYYESLLKKKLNIEFKLGNFFKIDIKKKFDIVWMMETIHHIEPPRKVLSFAYNCLNPNGYIIICDTNGFNLLVQIKLFLERGVSLHREVVDPNSGEKVPYGNENIFTVWRTKRMLEEAGFKIEKIYYQRFLPSFKPVEKHFRIFKKVEDLLRKTPILKTFAAGYTIVGYKI